MTASRTSLYFDFAWAVAAFFFWGGWAGWVNSPAGGPAALFAGLVQGAFSFVMTLLMVRSVTWIYNRLGGRRIRSVLPALVTVGASGSLLAATHVLAGTPRIFPTIAAPLTVAFCFCVYIAIHLEGKPPQR